MTEKRIRVLLVDDSLFALTGLARLVQQEPDLEVVGKAKSGKEALELLPQVKPDIVCVDYYMTGMDGYELTKIIMSLAPMPILIVSGILSSKDSAKIFDLLEAGALDVIGKPLMYSADEKPAKEFITKIRLLSKVFVLKKGRPQSPVAGPVPLEIPSLEHLHYHILALGASTGGPMAIKTVIERFPANFPLPIVAVQHMSLGFLDGFVHWLEESTHFKVKIAENNEVPIPGRLYFPPEDMHLYITPQGTLACTQTIRTEQHHRPSIDVLMESVAKYYGNKAIGALLTGMGKDGAHGMQAISKAGGAVIVQEAKSCIVASMPEEALKLTALPMVLPLTDIGPYILKLVEQKAEIA